MKESSPQVGPSASAEAFLLRSKKPQLPTDLLHSNPEVGNPGRAVTITRIARLSTTAQPFATAQLTATARLRTTARSRAAHQNLRHHEFVLERNEDVEDRLWSAMSRRLMPPAPMSRQDDDAVPRFWGEPGPTERNQPEHG